MLSNHRRSSHYMKQSVNLNCILLIQFQKSYWNNYRILIQFRLLFGYLHELVLLFHIILNYYSLRFQWSLSCWWRSTFWWPLPSSWTNPYFFYHITTHHSPWLPRNPHPTKCQAMENKFLLTTITVSQTHWDLTSSSCQPASANWTSNPCTSVYFHAQRIGIYDGLNTGISFNKININVGNTLDTWTGVFVAPDVPGKYFFSYSWLCHDTKTKIQMQSWRNGVRTWFLVLDSTDDNWLKIGEFLTVHRGMQCRFNRLCNLVEAIKWKLFSY